MWHNTKEGYRTKAIECGRVKVLIHRPESLTETERAKREAELHRALAHYAAQPRTHKEATSQ